MKLLSASRILGFSSAGLIAATMTMTVATPWPFYLTSWQAKYPGSSTDDNVINGTGSGCQVCHVSSNGGSPWNAYGWRVRMETQISGDIDLALTLAEPFDSDADPTGSSNLTEISSDTQPGWTDGANNTHYFGDGSTVTGQTPPAGILGDLDPGPATIGSSYCGPANTNSSGQSAAITATGSTVVNDNDVTLHASSLPTSQFGYFLSSPTQGFIANPAGSAGNFCLGGGGLLGRYNGNVQNSGGTGAFSFGIDLTAVPTGMAPGSIAIQPGDTWNFQAWFRDVGNTNNFTDGVNIVFQ